MTYKGLKDKLQNAKPLILFVTSISFFRLFHIKKYHVAILSKTSSDYDMSLCQAFNYLSDVNSFHLIYKNTLIHFIIV